MMWGEWDFGRGVLIVLAVVIVLLVLALAAGLCVGYFIWGIQ